MQKPLGGRRRQVTAGNTRAGPRRHGMALDVGDAGGVPTYEPQGRDVRVGAAARRAVRVGRGHGGSCGAAGVVGAGVADEVPDAADEQGAALLLREAGVGGHGGVLGRGSAGEVGHIFILDVHSWHCSGLGYSILCFA